MRQEALIVALVCESLTAGRMFNLNSSVLICVYLWFHESFFGHMISRSLQRGSIIFICCFTIQLKFQLNLIDIDMFARLYLPIAQ